jgi:hypothetical protein
LVAAGAASPVAAFSAASGAQIKKAHVIISLSGCILPQQIHPPNSTPLFSRSSGRKLKDTAETWENHKHFLGNSHTNFARQIPGREFSRGRRAIFHFRKSPSGLTSL